MKRAPATQKVDADIEERNYGDIYSNGICSDVECSPLKDVSIFKTYQLFYTSSLCYFNSSLLSFNDEFSFVNIRYYSYASTGVIV